VCWFARSFASSTVGSYIGHVKGLLAKWHGFIDLEDEGFTWSRLNKAIRILKRTRPAMTKQKRPFTFKMLAKIASRLRLKGRANLSFSIKVSWAAMVLAFNQLLRGNEVAQAQTMTFANRLPMVHSHIVHYGVDGKVLQHPVSPADARARLCSLASSKLTMPPSKADPEGHNLPLYLVGGCGGLSEWLSPASQIFLLQGDSPVLQVASRHHSIIFRVSPTSVRAITTNSLQHAAARLCRDAKINPDGIGTHAYRIGGMNHLMESGATIPQIMCIGRWSSDAWKLYARRNRSKLMSWSRKLTHSLH
jgi:hypothetical protein